MVQRKHCGYKTFNLEEIFLQYRIYIPIALAANFADNSGKVHTPAVDFTKLFLT